jgi:hypothetical protein
MLVSFLEGRGPSGVLRRSDQGVRPDAAAVRGLEAMRAKSDGNEEEDVCEFLSWLLVKKEQKDESDSKRKTKN